MSRANPIALRVTSKTQSSMFIGVSRYYFYDHLKQNLNIFKLTGLVSKQIVLPTNSRQLLKYKANSDNLTVLTPHLLPINTACTAKQLFSTKYRLNKRRFSSAILHYVCWLQDDFNTNYKRFNTGADFPKYAKSYKLSNLPIFGFGGKKNLGGSRQSDVKKSDTQFFIFTKANQINDIYKYFVFKRSSNAIPPYKFEPLKKNSEFINCLIRLTSLALLKRGGISPKANKPFPLARKTKIYTQTNLAAKGKIVMGKNLWFNSYNAAKLIKTPVLDHEKVHELCCFRPNYKDMTNNMLLLAFLNLLYSQNKTILSFLSNPALSLQLSARQQKGLLNTEKSTQFNTTNLDNYVDSAVDNLSTKYCYIVSAYSGSPNKGNKGKKGLSPKKSYTNSSNFSKVQKHINFFSSTAKPVIPLELIISRSFCEPAGLNYFTALENRLSKSRFNINFSSTLFRRISNNGFIPNYTNTQTGLIRLKAQIIFEFLYTLSSQSKSVIEQNNFLKHNRYALDSEKKLSMRKGSSIRL